MIPRWVEFGRRYRAELARNNKAITQILTLLEHGPVTSLFAAHDVEQNNAVVLAKHLARMSAGRHAAGA